MEYRLNLAKRMLFNKKGSLIGAVLAVTIGILVIHVNFVIFQGLFDAIVRDISDYRNGDILVTDDADYIDKSDLSLVNWFERIPFVEAATPRLEVFAIPRDGPRILVPGLKRWPNKPHLNLLLRIDARPSDSPCPR